MAAGANGSNANESVAHELHMLLRSHNKVDSILSKGLHRSGSAPPSVEGSLAALAGSHGSHIPGSGASNGTAVIDSEQELRSDPSYWAYYYAHVKLNPRLPPPIITRENYHFAQRLISNGATDMRKFGSMDDSNSRSLFASHSVLPTHKEEPEFSEDEKSPGGELLKQWNEQVVNDGLSGTAYVSNRQKSLVDLIQQDFPRTPSPVFSQLRPPSRVANDDGNDAANGQLSIPTTTTSAGELNAALGARSGTANPVMSSRSATPNPVMSSRSTTPKPGIVHMLGSSSGVSGPIARLPTPEPDLSLLNASVKIAKAGPSISAASTAELTASMQVLNVTGAQGSDSAEKHERLPLHQNGRSQSQPQTSQNQHQQQNRVPNNLSNGQASGSNNVYAAAAAAAMSYMSPYYQNIHAYAPHYGLAGYPVNPPLIPAVMTNYPPYDTTAAAAAAAAAAAVAASMGRPSSSGSPGAAALDAQQLYKYSTPGGVSLQDPLYYHYLQQYSTDDARVALDPAVLRSYMDPMELQKNQLNSMLRNGSYGVLLGGKTNTGNPAYYSGAPGVGFLMPYGSPQMSSSMLPGSPVMANPFALRQGDRNLRAPIANSRGATAGSYSNWQGQKSGEIGEDFKGSSLLEELKTNKTRKFELADIAGHVVEFSSDQHGSRFIQQKLETVPLEEKAAVFEEVLPHALKLMTDVFGNYVIQKFFEHGSPEQRSKLADQLVGHVLVLSLQMYGCRVIQKALEVLDVEQKVRLISELEGEVMRCIRDQNGNHVIQKCIECVPPDHISFILSSFSGHVVSLSIHPYGCRVIQRVLEHCNEDQKQAGMMEEILGSICTLAQDQYGNYVVQHILEHGKPDEKREILTKMAGQIVPMSQHKFASNVVEKCLEFGGPAEREILITEMLGLTEDNEPLQAMMKDQYANYVVQKVLETCDDQQREMLLSRIKVHLHALKKYTYGKHIVARVEKLVAAGERRGTTTT